jgi:hypothetical protein
LLGGSALLSGVADSGAFQNRCVYICVCIYIYLRYTSTVRWNLVKIQKTTLYDLSNLHFIGQGDHGPTGHGDAGES